MMRFKLFDSQAKAKELLSNDQPRLIRAGDKEICLVRRGDTLFAFQNECPHMGERLHTGKLNYLNEIVCPLHTYRFNITTGEESAARCKPMATFPIIQMNDGIYIEC